MSGLDCLALGALEGVGQGLRVQGRKQQPIKSQTAGARGLGQEHADKFQRQKGGLCSRKGIIGHGRRQEEARPLLAFL